MKENEIFTNCKNLPSPLTKEETYELFGRIYNGDIEAKEKIAHHNIKLVLNQVSKKFANTGYEKTELVEIGCIGLTKAINTFNIDKGIEFSTYALPCIDNEIKNFLFKNNKNINTRSLNDLITTRSNNVTEKLEDTIGDTFNLEEDYQDKYLKEYLKIVIEDLSDKEKRIIVCYFGFNNNKPLTLAEIAKKFNISISWSGVILNKAILKIKNKLKETGMIEENVESYQKKKCKTTK